MIDFTFQTYLKLLQSLKQSGHCFSSVSDYFKGSTASRFILLRHDVEKHYDHALWFAKEENKMRIRGTYYFRFSKKYFDKEIVEKIANLGHEIGYHYDDLSLSKGNFDLAIDRFQKNLKSLREIATVETICMDGSPMSKYDNRELWKKYDYKSFGVIGEPYIDIDFKEVMYFTDTGRRWDGLKFSVRDKIPKGNEKNEPWRPQYHTTHDIIRAAALNQLPEKLMFTFHPQRWTDKPLLWVKELIFQNIKNIGKRILIRKSEDN